MAMIAPMDSMFLLQESRDQPAHVAGLLTFKPPPEAGEDYVGVLYKKLLEYKEVAPMFGRHPRESLGNFWWTDETNVDMAYHVRRSALPRPGTLDELLDHVSRLHGTLLDRHHPLWEFHLIEGLEDGRFAVYVKAHHALSDGIGLTRKILRACTPDPDVRNTPPMWSPVDEAKKVEAKGHVGGPMETFRHAGRTLKGVKGMGSMLAEYGRAAMQDQTAVLPYDAPATMLNQSISGARRVAVRSWDLSRTLTASKARGITLNDMVLAMCAGALRRYLLANDGLPEEPLICSVPVSLRAGDGDEGNAITFVLCNLATDLEDPQARLDAITSSMRATKAVMADRPGLQLSAMGVLTTVGPAALTRLPGASAMRPPYNILISNVPGPRKRLYWNGAELEAIFPISIPTEYQALNITCLSYADHLEFGLVGCRLAVPEMQRILDYLEDSLRELE